MFGKKKRKNSDFCKADSGCISGPSDTGSSLPSNHLRFNSEQKKQSPDTALQFTAPFWTDCMQYDPPDVASCYHWHCHRNISSFDGISWVYFLYCGPALLKALHQSDGDKSSLQESALLQEFRAIWLTWDSSVTEHFLVSVEPALDLLFFCSFTRPAAFCTRWEEPCQENKTFLQQ